MTTEHTNTESMTAEQAMGIALKAEGESLQSITECEAGAERILEQARQSAHRISQRADARITRVHQSCKLAADVEINRLQQPVECRLDNIENLTRDTDSVTSAVTRLAESLTMTDKPTGNRGA